MSEPQDKRTKRDMLARMGGSSRCLAAAATVVLCTLFLQLVRLEVPVDARPASRSAPSCQQLGAAPPQASENLQSWLEVFDPTVLVLRNQQHGFARLSALPRAIPVTAPPLDRTPRALSAETRPPAPALGNPPPNPRHVLRTAWPGATPAAEPRIPKPAPRGVLWRFANGTPLASPPGISEETVRQATAETAPDRPTRLIISLLDGTPRLRVVHSCGVRTLDLLALQKLTGPLAPFIVDPTTSRAAARALPETHPAAHGGPVVVEVEWRLALPPPEENDAP